MIINLRSSWFSSNLFIITLGNMKRKVWTKCIHILGYDLNCSILPRRHRESIWLKKKGIRKHEMVEWKDNWRKKLPEMCLWIFQWGWHSWCWPLTDSTKKHPDTSQGLWSPFAFFCFFFICFFHGVLICLIFFRNMSIALNWSVISLQSSSCSYLIV